MKATASLFARMLVIARSSRDDIELEEVIGLHEFDYTNRVLMKPGGSIHHTSDKSIIIHLQEDIVNNTGDTTNAMDDEVCPQTCLVVDTMGVVQELMAVMNFKKCKELGATYVKLIDSNARGYDQVRLIFDNYTYQHHSRKAQDSGAEASLRESVPTKLNIRLALETIQCS